MPQFNTFRYNAFQYNVGGESFLKELDKQQDTKPKVKVEFITTDGTAYDISVYYLGGGVLERTKERAPDEIQAGDFDVVLSNHDDYFSEYNASSLLYGIQYHGARIKIYLGFELPDGRTEYRAMQVGYIDELYAHSGDSKVTFRCRDLIRRILDEKFHKRPTAEVAAAASGNTGDGTCSKVDTLPFKTTNEDWTLTCTTAGGDGTAEFSVIGSVSGNVGTATSGTQFSTGTGAGGIRFTIKVGGTAWVLDDAFTFSTRQYPQWTLENPIKLLWSVLTGYNWDSEAQFSWYDFVLDLDNTKSSSNTDIDYDSFNDIVNDFAAVDKLSGYIEYEEDPASFLEGLLIHFLGSLFTDGDGRIVVKSYRPQWGSAFPIRTFSDDKKIKSLGYNRTVNEIINHVEIQYKKTSNWDFSGDDITYDGVYVKDDSDSQANYDVMPFVWESRWFSTTGDHVQDLANRLVSKYADPPLNVSFATGLDGSILTVGDRIYVTDDKYSFEDLPAEVSKLVMKFDAEPMEIGVNARRDGDLNINWGFLGSSADEGDGLSPQSAAYGSASATDKLFCYLGADDDTAPNYRMF